MKISPNFTYEEMTRSATAIRLGIDNTCPPELVPNMKRIAETLELIRAYFGRPVKVTSCYRSPAVNKAVGGSKTSAHCKANAVDFEVVGVTNIEVCRKAAGIVPDFDQVLYEFGPAGWVHLGLDDNPRRQLLTASKVNGKTVYTPGINA